MYKRILMTLLCLAPIVPLSAAGGSGTEEDHEELRKLLTLVKEATDQNRAELLKPYLHEDFVMTVLNQQVAVGRDGLEKLFDDWFQQEGAPLKSLVIEPAATVPTRIVDDRFGTVYGTSADTYELADGDKFVFNSHWTATVLKEDGRWKVVTVHVGVDPLDNPLINAYRKAMGLGGVAIEFGKLFQ
jgi:ketosteroid isomerase-like protein